MKKLNISKRFLQKEYIQNKKSTRQIGRMINCSNTTVADYMRKYNISRRTISEGCRGKNNGRFIDGRYLKNYYCKDCDKEISASSGVRGQGRCNHCANKINSFKLWKNKEYREKNIKSILKSLHLKPNKPEKLLTKLLNKILPKEYKFIGDGKVWIVNFCPDFINVNGQKKIIELYGDYWHNREDAKKRDKLRLKTYTKYGYKTLIVWEKELKNLQKVKEKILEFHNE